MSLNEIFQAHYPKGNRMPKNLRHNAREAAEYLSGIPYKEDPDTVKLQGSYGRSSGSNN